MSPMLLATFAVFACRELFALRAARGFSAELEANETEKILALKAASKARFGALSELMRPRTLAELSDLRRRLFRAGLRTDEAVDLYGLARSISVIVGLFFAAVFFLASSRDLMALLISALVALVGLYVPQFWLKGRIEKRQAALTNALPPTLDLLVTCMEAGLGLEQALARVSQETAFSDPEMSDELVVLVAEIRAGLGVAEAFRKLADRVTSDDMRNLANVVGQAAQLGAAMGRTMREYAASARRRRVLGLEEAAGKVTAKLTLPLTLCLMPAALMIMLGPAIVMISTSMGTK